MTIGKSSNALALLAAFAMLGCATDTAHPVAQSVTVAPAPAYNAYTGDVRIDPATGMLDADWTITFVDPELQHIDFLLNRHFGDIKVGGDATFSEITEDNVFDSAVSRISIQLAPAQKSAPRKLTISYGGVLFPTPMENGINSISPGKIELTVDSLWHPFDSRFTEPAIAEFNLSAPGDWTVISNGRTAKVSEGVWRVTAAPGIDIPVTALRDFRLTEAPGYAIYDTRKADSGVPELVKGAALCTSFLNSRFGDEDPLPEAKIVVHDRPASGYSRKTLIALSEIAGRDETRLTQFICHELAHYWSAHGRADTVENWLNESFADYAALMAVREGLGEEAFDGFLVRYQRQVDEAGALPPIWTPGAVERGPDLVAYRKGPLALAELEREIGRQVFAEFFRRYMTEGIATTPALLDALEAVAGTKAREMFILQLAA